MTSSRPTINRREFLKSLGVASAGLISIPWIGGWKDFQISSPEGPALRVGAVIPTYLKEPKRAKHWLKGLRLGLSRFVGTNLIPYTADDRVLSVSGTLKDLIQVAQPDVIVGSVSPFASAQIANALQGTATIFLNAEVGANLIQPSVVRANVFHHTLHYWQANWAAGEWAAQTMGKRGVILATFYESGYDALAAFQLAFEQAGGEILRTVITHSPTESWNPREALARIAALQPDFVYLMGVGNETVELQAELKNSSLAGIPLVGTGFSLPGETNHTGTFHSDYLNATGDAPDAMALLGYESGLLIHAVRQMMGQIGVSLSEAFSTAAFDSPRGQVVMDADIHATTATSFVDGDANLLSHLPSVDSRLARLHPNWSDIRTGWITPYFSL